MATAFHARPHPPLSAFIETLWLYESDTPPIHARERRLPDGAMSLVLNLRDDRQRIYDPKVPDRFHDLRGGVLSGAHSSFTLLDTSCTTAALGVQFKPGGASAFLHLSASELRGEVVALEDVWGACARDLRGQVLAAETPAARVRVLECWLLTRLTPDWVAHPAVTFALDTFQDVAARPTIAAVTDQIGLSSTRFIQLFRDAVGLTPKQFCRIQRFQRVLRFLERDAPFRWGELAAASGYFDQAHLIHEFQAFSGLTPGAYLAARSAYRNHVPLPN